jgi:hypothetical protein
VADDGGEYLVAVGVYVGRDGDLFAHGALGGEATAGDLRLDRLDDDAGRSLSGGWDHGAAVGVGLDMLLEGRKFGAA